MPLDQIKREIEFKTEEEILRLRESTRADSKKIVAQAQERAEQIIENAKKELEKELLSARTELEANSEMEAKRITLGALEDALEDELRVIRKDLLSRLRSPDVYKAIFSAARAKAYVLGDDFIVAVGKGDEKLAESALKIKHVEHENIEGLILYSSDRKIILDMRLEKIADSLIDEVKGSVMEQLAGGNGTTTRTARPKAAKVVKSKQKKKAAAPKAKKGAKKAVKKKR